MNIYLETYGCTANKSDESIARGILQKEHHTFVDDIHQADILILLTCTVIGTTEQRMLSRLRTFKKTNKKIIVSGCMPQVQPELITSIVPHAFLLPPQKIHTIAQLIDRKKNIPTKQEATTLPKQYTSLAAPITIATGCKYSCSYCITHFARGALHSYSEQTIINDINQALHQGCKEILLTAQDTASYGIDTKTNLGKLLQNVCKINGKFRIRVGMMNPHTAQQNIDAILPAYHHPNIYKFLHLPIQSGDNTILEQMNRKYQIKDVKTIISTFRKQYPTLTLATDIIVGFPGETEEHFQHSVNLLQTIKPDIVNITRFSARPLTKAKTMKPRIPTDIVKERSRHLTKICQQISRQQNKTHINKQYTVLITKKQDDTVMGRADNYKPVIIQDQIQLGEIISVQIIDAGDIHLYGKLI